MELPAIKRQSKGHGIGLAPVVREVLALHNPIIENVSKKKLNKNSSTISLQSKSKAKLSMHVRYKTNILANPLKDKLNESKPKINPRIPIKRYRSTCLLYTSDAADE
eukprot:TRINITY_DN11340_c0_g1_i2.p1 TRINITY_DN11340_c0_g1~~TRINITY_DN11340_c0_g1_i2.p1  ORF type:complete len:107 (-),score=16.80 TRINITY_DN11340_c0_g1_i2:28-348(-)